MSRVILVRHAQASFLEPNYDKLCATGEVQARLLGEYWARRGALFSCALVGSSRAAGADRARDHGSLSKLWT